MNVVIIAMAPWAKLMMFVARKISTKASATEAKMNPSESPPRVMLKKSRILLLEAEVVVAEIAVGGHGLGLVGHDHAAEVDHDGPRRDREGAAGVLFDEEDRQVPALREPHEHGHQAGGDDRGQPERGLVEQEERRPGHDRPADGQHLALAPR